MVEPGDGTGDGGGDESGGEPADGGDDCAVGGRGSGLRWLALFVPLGAAFRRRAAVR